jgi:predicted  nucleic acid-binding Zn-ribbon protein
MIGLNIQTSFLTPPFGFALFYLRGVAPAAVRTISMYKGVVPFIMLQLLALVVVGFTPALVNYLPTRISLTSETAPPPVNPRLQYCMENYVFAEYETQGQAIRDAIAAMRDVDLSYLPKDRAKDITEALDKAESTFGLLTEINAADAAVRSVEAEYRPLHTQVRRIERDIAQHDEKIAAIQKQMGRLRDNPERVQALELETAELTAERDSLAASIPSDWDAEHAAFAELQKAETQARSAYRRTVDEAYAPIQESIAVLSATPFLISLENELQSLGDSIRGGDPEVTRDRISEVSSLIGGAEGSRDIRSSLTKASRALRGDSPDREEALESLAKAQEAFEEDVTWRERAQTDLLPELVSYEAAIRSTIGLRQQPRLPVDQALAVSGCLAEHRDISLNF